MRGPVTQQAIGHVAFTNVRSDISNNGEGMYPRRGCWLAPRPTLRHAVIESAATGGRTMSSPPRFRRRAWLAWIYLIVSYSSEAVDGEARRLFLGATQEAGLYAVKKQG
ncbi:hypothetical protein JTB14_006339 [Gonioctena quinquepunctata]|nr:hypothetical protein JTB14_006339 [Gonioctena quinquepunctata]